MNKAQQYLINAGINDIVVYGGNSKDPRDWKYLSDVLGEFHLTSHSNRAAGACADCRWLPEEKGKSCHIPGCRYYPPPA